MDQQDKDRAALNIKFEYERAKRLNAIHVHAEFQENPDLMFYDDIDAKWDEIGDSLSLKRKILAQKELEALDQGFAIIEEHHAPMVTMITPEEPPQSILNLALSLAVRFLLVLGVAILVLAEVTK